MTVGELIEKLREHDLAIPVVMSIEDPEVGGDILADPHDVGRVVRSDGVYVGVFG